MNNFSVVVTWQNSYSTYRPQGWTHAKKEFYEKTTTKEFSRFVDAMQYLHNVSSYAGALRALYVNHKTGETKEYVF